MSSSRLINRIARLDKNNVAFLLCDMQEKFSAMSLKFEEVTEVSSRLCQAAAIFKRPLLISEHHPHIFGKTVPDLVAASKDNGIFYIKKKFSMVSPELEKHLGNSKSVILFGVETHVCVYQSALDLLERGIDVHLVADATSSRTQVDRHFALTRLSNAGVSVTTFECAMFELLQDVNGPEFKKMLPLVRDSTPDSGLLPSLDMSNTKVDVSTIDPEIVQVLQNKDISLDTAK